MTNKTLEEIEAELDALEYICRPLAEDVTIDDEKDEEGHEGI